MNNSYIKSETRTRLSQVRLLALDCDGVLTDGGVYVFDDGREFRRFDIKDGLGLKRVIKLGIHVAIISGSDSAAMKLRAKRLGILDVYSGVEDKLSTMLAICDRLDITLDHVAYIGDDLPDLPILERSILPCAPCDAHEEVLEKALFVTSRAGGHGAVREVCDLFENLRIK